MEKQRVPFWKRLRKRLLPFPGERGKFAEQTIKSLPLLALVVLLVSFYIARLARLAHPPGGLYIGVLAFLAGAVTLEAPTKSWSKAAWLVVFRIFLMAEVTTLYRQRVEDQQTDRTKRKEEDDRFAGLLSTQQTSFGEVLKQNQREFEATLKRFDIVLSKEQEAVSVSTGGNTFPVAMPAVNPTNNGKSEIGFWLQAIGRYPLYRLQVSVSRVYRSRSDPKQMRGFGGSIKRDEFSAGVGGALITSLPEPLESPAYYVADMAARNGQWEEIIESRAIGSTYTFHWIVYGSTSLTPSSMFGPYKKILDLADNNFPPEARKALTYPLDPQLLPLEPVTQDPR